MSRTLKIKYGWEIATPIDISLLKKKNKMAMTACLMFKSGQHYSNYINGLTYRTKNVNILWGYTPQPLTPRKAFASQKKKKLEINCPPNPQLYYIIQDYYKN